MGYTQRLIIGVIVAFYAYSLFQDASMRFQIHQIAVKISELIHSQPCYNCTEQLRNVIAAFVFASGICLVFDVSTRMAIASQLFFTGISLYSLNGCFCYGKVQNVFIHSLMLLLLLSNAKEQSKQASGCSNQKSGEHRHSGSQNVKIQNRAQADNSAERLVQEPRAANRQPLKRQGRKN